MHLFILFSILDLVYSYSYGTHPTFPPSSLNPGQIVCPSRDSKLPNATDLIANCSYPWEVHNVTTSDGYILTMQRIPRVNKPRNTCKYNLESAQQGVPVLLLPGLLATADTFLFNGCNESLAFYLAECGYDVWLGNFRGTTYSLDHTNLNCSFSQYWKFSWDEMGRFDIPAFIDYIIEKSGRKKTIVIGHSMGGSASLVRLSEKPEYQEKILLVVGLSPAAYLSHSTSILLTMSKTDLLLKLLKLPFLGAKNLINFFGKYCKVPLINNLCLAIMYAIFGKEDPKNFDTTQLGHYLEYFPAVVSMQSISHFYQVKNTGEFKAYHYGTEKENIEKYNTTTPPFYTYEKSNVSYILVSGTSDNICNIKDQEALYNLLNQTRSVTFIIIEKYTHLDFIWGKRSSEVFFPILTNNMKNSVPIN